LWLKTLYRKRAVTWPFIFYTIIWTLSSTLLLTFGSTILPTGIVFASEQNIIKNTSYSNDDNLNVSIEKTRTVVLW
ncbi:hypothetical protein ABXM75_02960, partial [Enterococcus faecium]